MFDATGTFARQFTPVDGGYLYYPSRRAGGKLVTADEYEKLVADWQRVGGRRGRWQVSALVIGFIIFWAIVFQVMALPDWTKGVVVAVCVASISAWFCWASFAARRLVGGRPDITPPRSPSEAKREARALFNWRVVIFGLLFSGSILISTLISPGRALGWWAWMIGSGALFCTYLWIAFQKARDRR